MYEMNVRSTWAAAKLSVNHLSPNGLLVFTGSSSSLSPTPSMLSYGSSKSSVHHIVSSLAALTDTNNTDKTDKTDALPPQTKVIGILPTTLDTPSNRRSMPNSDFSSWTTTETISERLFDWASGKEPVVNGRLYVFETINGNTFVRASACS